jgi:beta-aspartyl-peptidase (threonine type)
MFAIAVHGGSGTLLKEKMSEPLKYAHEEELRAGLLKGACVLQGSGSSLEAVEAAVAYLEDCELFNAGKGSVYNSEGKHEMDAAIMDGYTKNAGAIAGVSNIKNPIRLARAVLNDGNRLFLSGRKAEDFALTQGLDFETDNYFQTDLRYLEWKAECDDSKHLRDQKFGTVGAVALDQNGHLAAATSTGGITNKRYGRIGDSCIIGAGTYANDETCAVSCTGDGEKFIRAVAAHNISAMIAYQNRSLNDACAQVLNGLLPDMKNSGGIIGIDPAGNIAMVFNTPGMYRACFRTDGSIEVGIF